MNKASSLAHSPASINCMEADRCPRIAAIECAMTDDAATVDGGQTVGTLAAEASRCSFAFVC